MSAAKENNADLAVADKVDGNEKTNSAETQQNRLYKGTKRQGDVSVEYFEAYCLYYTHFLASN